MAGHQAVYQQSRLLLPNANGEAQRKLKVCTLRQRLRHYIESRKGRARCYTFKPCSSKAEAELWEVQFSLVNKVSSGQPALQIHSERLPLKYINNTLMYMLYMDSII